MIYFLIFLAKILENALSTLRLIIVASGKKIFGCILQLCITLLWICITSIVIQSLTDDPFKVVAFTLGSTIGSYLGSMLEEKLALGYILITYETTKDNKFSKVLNTNKISFNSILTNEKKTLFSILIPRKKQNHIFHLIRKYDYNATITISSIKPIIFDN